MHIFPFSVKFNIPGLYWWAGIQVEGMAKITRTYVWFTYDNQWWPMIVMEHKAPIGCTLVDALCCKSKQLRGTRVVPEGYSLDFPGLFLAMRLLKTRTLSSTQRQRMCTLAISSLQRKWRLARLRSWYWTGSPRSGRWSILDIGACEVIMETFVVKKWSPLRIHA